MQVHVQVHVQCAYAGALDRAGEPRRCSHVIVSMCPRGYAYDCAAAHADPHPQVLSIELASKDVESQAVAQQGEVDLRRKQAELRELRARVDAAPAERASRLSELHARVHGAQASLEEARRRLSSAHASLAAEDRAAWDGAEERVAALAAQAAAETAAAQAAEEAALTALSRLVERIARLEEVLGEESVAPLAASRRAAAALVVGELTGRPHPCICVCMRM